MYEYFKKTDDCKDIGFDIQTSDGKELSESQSSLVKIEEGVIKIDQKEFVTGQGDMDLLLVADY